MNNIKRLRLSSDDVIVDYPHVITRAWKTAYMMKFTFCSSTCSAKDDHEFRYDGQLFYRKKVKDMGYA